MKCCIPLESIVEMVIKFWTEHNMMIDNIELPDRTHQLNIIQKRNANFLFITATTKEGGKIYAAEL